MTTVTYRAGSPRLHLSASADRIADLLPSKLVSDVVAAMLRRYPAHEWDVYQNRHGVLVWLLNQRGYGRHSQPRRSAAAILQDLEPR